VGKNKKFHKFFREQKALPKDSTHHIIPSSRISSDRAEKSKNKVKVNDSLHKKFHALMLNRTPEECLRFLVNYFWGGNLDFVRNFLRKEEENE
jgi:hypothetical protein